MILKWRRNCNAWAARTMHSKPVWLNLSFTTEVDLPASVPPFLLQFDPQKFNRVSNRPIAFSSRNMAFIYLTNCWETCKACKKDSFCTSQIQLDAPIFPIEDTSRIWWTENVENDRKWRSNFTVSSKEPAWMKVHLNLQ